jgi:glycosyltransferase involved in cell wall biosynthesis
VHEEDCGLSFPWSEVAFREAVVRLMDPVFRQRLADHGRAAAEREFNWGKMKERLLETYAELYPNGLPDR